MQIEGDPRCNDDGITGYRVTRPTVNGTVTGADNVAAVPQGMLRLISYASGATGFIRNAVPLMSGSSSQKNPKVVHRRI